MSKKEETTEAEGPRNFGVFLTHLDDGDAVILAYRISGGAVVWSYSLYRADKALDDAFKRAVEQVKSTVKSEVFFGSPE